MADNMTNDLLKIKKRIENSKIEIAKLEGANATLLANLKNDFDCSDIEEASTKLEELSKEIDSLNSEIEKGYKELIQKLEAIEAEND